jgi:hypothetical protein
VADSAVGLTANRDSQPVYKDAGKMKKSTAELDEEELYEDGDEESAEETVEDEENDEADATADENEEGDEIPKKRNKKPAAKKTPAKKKTGKEKPLPKNKEKPVLKRKGSAKDKPAGKSTPLPKKKAKPVLKRKGSAAKDKPVVARKGSKGGISNQLGKRPSQEKGGFASRMESFKFKELSFTAGSTKKRKLSDSVPEAGIGLSEATTRNEMLAQILKRRYYTSLALCALAFLSFVFGAAEQQTLWKLDNKPNAACDWLKQCVTLFSLASVFFVMMKHRLFTKQQKIMGRLPLEAHKWTSGHGRNMFMLEIIFNLVSKLVTR